MFWYNVYAACTATLDMYCLSSSQYSNTEDAYVHTKVIYSYVLCYATVDIKRCILLRICVVCFC